jgi:magnesium transporter
MMKSDFLWVLPDGTLESLDSLENATKKIGEPGFVWFNFVKASREELSELSAPLGLHPLSIEDCTDETQVPKMDEFPNYTFIVFNALRYDPEELISDEVDFFIGSNFLVTVSGYADYTQFPINGIMPVVERNNSAVKKGPAWLMHLIMDYMVDNMANVVEQAEVDIDKAEEKILDSPSALIRHGSTYLRRTC